MNRWVKRGDVFMMNLRYWIFICYSSLDRNKTFYTSQLPIFCCTRVLPVLTLIGKIQKERKFEVVNGPAASWIHTWPSSPPGCFQHPGYGCRHVRGCGNVRVYTLAVIPAHSKQVPCAAKNISMDSEEDRACQHILELPVLCYSIIMSLYSYPLFGVIFMVILHDFIITKYPKFTFWAIEPF